MSSNYRRTPPSVTQKNGWTSTETSVNALKYAMDMYGMNATYSVLHVSVDTHPTLKLELKRMILVG